MSEIILTEPNNKKNNAFTLTDVYLEMAPKVCDNLFHVSLLGLLVFVSERKKCQSTVLIRELCLVN